MLLELARPVSLLTSIWSLLAVFHAAFLGSETDFRQRIFDALVMLVVALAASLTSGMIFTQKSNPRLGLHLVWPATRALARQEFSFQSLIGSFPMCVFYWAVGWMATLFLAAWLIETYCIPLGSVRY